ncbi:saccharopine dehydrogenase C-terminal domain-containing protein [Pseudomonas batumici]|uniref:saccharopine dehydrogenase C-terminal domain-containing protein n=1 Tax=Pseudomonas batumici TaxID=226910 RepID=UPI0030D38747
MKKRIGLIGCGNLGYPLAYYIERLGFDELYVHDLDPEKAAGLKQKMEETCPLLQVKDHLDVDGLDVIVLSLSGPQTTAFVTDPRNHGLFRGRPVFVSLGRPNYDDPAAHEVLDHYLVENGVSLLFGFGLEPGLVEVLMHDLASTHQGEVVKLSAVCGGVPLRPNPPLNYDLLFGEHLPSLNRSALFKMDDRLGSCKRFDMKEAAFVEGVGALEVYHDGLSPYLLSTPCVQQIPGVKQQTARWPGFFDCMRVLLSLGLLDEQARLDGGSTASAQTHAILRQNGKLARNRPDISFVEVCAQLESGKQEKVSIVSTFDERTQLTGMAQLTSFMAAWAARRVMDRPQSCRPGLILGHEFFDKSETGALLDAFRVHVNCTVRISP